MVIVQGPPLLIDAIVAVLPLSGVTAMWPAPAAVVGAVQPAGTRSVTWAPELKDFLLGPENVKEKVLTVLPAQALVGETVIEPSPSPALPASVNWVVATEPEIWPVAVSSSVAPSSSWSRGTSQVVEKFPLLSAVTDHGR